MLVHRPTTLMLALALTLPLLSHAAAPTPTVKPAAEASTADVRGPTDLKPGEYILETRERKPAVSRSISPQLRNEILERNGYTCQLCGAGPGDPDPFNPSRKVRLHIDHVKPSSQGGIVSKGNLRVLCSACNQGRANIQPPSDTALNVLAKIRKLPRLEQQEIFKFLKRKFEAAE